MCIRERDIVEDSKLVLTPKKFKTDATTILSARVSTDLLKKIENLASKTNRNRNEMVQILLAYAVEHAVIDEEGK